MRLFRLGYVFTISFFLLLAIVTLTFGFYQAPAGPKAPAYPSITPSYSMASPSSFNDAEYQRQMEDYQKKQTQYQEDQKHFLGQKVVPYARNVFVFWIVVLFAIVALGVLLAYLGAELAGAGLAFTGVWAVLFGPLGCMVWFAQSLVRSFGGKAEEDFSVTSLLQAVGIASGLAVLVLLILGVLLFRERRSKQSPTF